MIRVALVQGSLLYGQNVMNRLSLGSSSIKLLLVKLTKTIPTVRAWVCPLHTQYAVPEVARGPAVQYTHQPV